MNNKILRFLLDNPKEYINLSYLEDLLQEEEYILYFYCSEFSKKEIPMTIDNLTSALEEHKLLWVNENSKFSNKYGVINKDYLQERASDRYLNDNDSFADTFVSVVINRYNELMQEEPITFSEYNSLVEAERAHIQKGLFQNIISKISPLILGKVSTITYNGITYDISSILELTSAMCTDKSLKIKNIVDDITKTEEHKLQLSSIISESTALDATFFWNLGYPEDRPILPTPVPGDIIAIAAKEKIGKTSFTLGEIVYPALVNGKNVKIYSGEMGIHELYTKLVLKHIYTKYGITLDYNHTKDVIILSEKFKANTITEKELEVLNNISREYKEYILLGIQFFVSPTSKVGRLELITPTTPDGKIHNEFIMENHLTSILNSHQNRHPDNRAHLVIYDHINSFITRCGYRLEDFTQDIVRAAKNKTDPYTAVIINHLRSDDVDSKLTSKTTIRDIEQTKFSSHGTRELEKSATMYINLLDTTELKKAGQLYLKVAETRSFNVFDYHKTNTFKLTTNNAVCDFVSVNKNKQSYEHS